MKPKLTRVDGSTSPASWKLVSLSETSSEDLAHNSQLNPVLIVDDDPDSRESLRMAFEHRGIPCLEAENGKSALSILRETDVCCIVTDFQMPIMNGCEFMEQLSQETQDPPPALMVTGNLTENVRDRALKAGVLQVLTKPFDQKKILRLVEAFIKKRHGH